MSWESTQEAWRLRYGWEPPAGLPDLGALLSHRSVRKYANQPIPETTIAGLVAAAQSAATSSNLQSWSVISVQDPERRERMAQLCGDQDQVRHAAWFLAFLVDLHRLNASTSAQGTPPAGLDFAETFILGAVDAALAAERMVVAAESLGIGICYIGALRNQPDQVAELLGLPEHVFGIFGLCLGYPDLKTPAEIKPRLSQEAVWFRETYDADPNVQEYEARMSAFYESQGMKGDVTWAMRSGRRLSPGYMGGREGLKAHLESLGFWRR